MNLTKQQESVLTHATQNGYININERYKFYSTEKSFANAINRLVSLEFLKEDVGVLGRWSWTGKEE